MKIEFFAGNWAHYVRHLYPIWANLPQEYRGEFSLITGGSAEAQAKLLGIPYRRFRQYSSSVLVAVASFEDYRATKPAKVIFVNHGVGQTYVDAKMGSYSGGPGRDRTVLFLCTSERDAQANRLAYPGTVCAAVGVPYLDSPELLQRISFNPDIPTVTFSFHANIMAPPETRWAVDWAKPGLLDLVNSNNSYKLLGHFHPRVRTQLEVFWRKLGIPVEPDFHQVLRVSDCYVIDNSSSGYEAAAIGIPTVWWNPPFYRRDVHHGLRFWEAIPGVEVDDPMAIGPAIELALQNPPELQLKRDRALSIAYGDADGCSLVDGHATDRAVTACLQTADSLTSLTPC